MFSNVVNANGPKNFKPVLTTQTAAEDTHTYQAAFINQERVAIPDLIDRLLELSRIQAGTIDLYLEPCQMSEVFQASVADLQAIAPEHKICIDIGADVLPVMADAGRVQQVLVALVDNAAKFSPAGSTIWISAYRQGSFVQINVSDQGVGIDLECSEDVFEAYRQPEYQMSNSAGLGLAISKGLIEALGGRIWIGDRPRKGFRTVVSFNLPIVTASNWNRAITRRRKTGFTSDSLMAEPYLMPV